MHDAIIFIEALCFIYFAFLAGKLFLKALPAFPQGVFSKNVYILLAGFGILGLMGLFLAIFGIFSAFYVRACLLVLACVSFYEMRSHGHALARTLCHPRPLLSTIYEWLRQDFYFKIILLFWLGMNMIIVLVPLTGNDTLHYHEPIIQDFIRTGQIDYRGTSHSIYGVLTFVEIVYALPSVLFGNIATPFIFQALQYAALIMLLLLMYGFAKKRVSHPVLRIALLFFILSIFDLQREAMHGGYIDIFVILFGIAGVLLIIDLFDDASALLFPAGILSAFLLGIALSMKYSALFFAVPIGIFLLALMAHRHMALGKKIGFIVMYGATSLAVSGYWYIKNFIFFGNPVYPIFSLAETKADFGVFVADKTVLNMFLFPFLKFGAVSETDSSTKLIIAGYFALAYAFMVLFILFRRRMVSASAYVLFVFIHIYLWLMFFNSHQTRFLLPAIVSVPLLLVLLGDAFYRYMESISKPSVYRFFMSLSRGIFLALFVFLFLGNIHYFYVKFLYKAGFYTQEEYSIKIGGQ